TWAAFLMVLGVLSVATAAVGVISWAIAIEGVWDTLAVLLIGGPVAILLAAWPVALGQALRAIADIGDAVSEEPMPRVAGI
ncbi:MAG TPA: hypothetical protein VF183_08125, partial [Acidimicrobiales bacterium]